MLPREQETSLGQQSATTSPLPENVSAWFGGVIRFNDAIVRAFSDIVNQSWKLVWRAKTFRRLLSTANVHVSAT